MIVDDEESVHQVTELVMKNFSFENRHLKFLHAYSASEAKELLSRHPDTALILLDVVMETEKAGLDLVHTIRQELHNQLVRIVLRTGQPGQAPEERVVVEYDINGYKEKTELTAQRLFTTVYAALRAYRDLDHIEREQAGMRRVLEACTEVLEHESTGNWHQGLFDSVKKLLQLEADCALVMSTTDDVHALVAGSGLYAKLVGRPSSEWPSTLRESVLETDDSSEVVLSSGNYNVLRFPEKGGRLTMQFVMPKRDFAPWEVQLVRLFATQISVAMQNHRLHQSLKDTQAEIVHMLADAVESRSQETGNHVKRVSKLARLLAEAMGTKRQEAELIELAAPLHDIGKIAIPDRILAKPGKHNDQEWEVMKTHAEIGWELLRHSRRPAIRMAAEISLAHHENWDGSGYPRGLAGDDIPLSAHLVAVADVFDALGSKRCYKDAWDEERIRDYFRKQRGKKFRPDLVDTLFDMWPQAMALRAAYPDSDELE